MSQTVPVTDRELRLAQVRGASKAYARHVRLTERAHAQLTSAIKAAHEAGASVTAISQAANLSRPAVHRAVAKVQEQ
jgi:hypothetical protein